VCGGVSSLACNILLGRTISMWALSKLTFPPEGQRLQDISFCCAISVVILKSQPAYSGQDIREL